MQSSEQVEVLPIETLGGLLGTGPELLFEKKQLIPALQQLLLSYPNSYHLDIFS